MLKIIFLAALIILNAISSPSAQISEFVEGRELLKEVDQVSIWISDPSDDARYCGIDKSLLRSTVVDRVVRAGLKTYDASPFNIDISILSLAEKETRFCTTAVLAISSIMHAVTSRSGQEVHKNKVFFAAVQLERRFSITSTAQSRHASAVRTHVQNAVAVLIAQWQEVNAGTRLTTGGSTPGRSLSPAAENVAEAQIILKKIGIYNHQIDGVLGQQTRNAIVQFQRQNGISPTGDLNEATLLLLRARQ